MPVNLLVLSAATMLVVANMKESKARVADLPDFRLTSELANALEAELRYQREL